MHDFVQYNDTLFTALVKPENAPINLSSWYSFKLWAKEPQEIYVYLKYEDGQHRYYPDVSYNGLDWIPLDSSQYLPITNDSVLFKLRLNQQPIWFSAQEMLTSQHNFDWIDSLNDLPFVDKQKIGRSRLGKELDVLSIHEPDGRQLVVILSRQHPPEVTGYMAMKAFVNEICNHSELAIRFRKKFEVIVFPMMNPGEVDLGHWRHNGGGVDLNRDWKDFNQPESWKSGVGSWKSEDRSQKSEVRSQKSEVGSRKTEVRRRESEVGSWKLEVGSWKSEVGRPGASK